MATKRKRTSRPRSKRAQAIHDEAERFAEAFGRAEVGRSLVGAGVVGDVAAQREGVHNGAVRVVLDNTIPQGFRMEPV